MGRRGANLLWGMENGVKRVEKGELMPVVGLNSGTPCPL